MSTPQLLNRIRLLQILVIARIVSAPPVEMNDRIFCFIEFTRIKGAILWIITSEIETQPFFSLLRSYFHGGFGCHRS